MSSTTKRVAAIAVIAAIGISLAACSGTAASDTSQSTSSSPVKGQTITWSIEKDLTTLNPQLNSQDAYTFVLRNVADSYLYLDDNGDYQPWLAQKFTESKDRLSITLDLRKDVTFSDGEAFNADAVIANFQNQLSEDNSNPPVWKSVLKDYKKTGDYQVQFNLKAVSPKFIEALSSTGTSPISPKSLKDTKNLETGGSAISLIGPYTISGYTKGSELTLKKNDTYQWDKWQPSELAKEYPGAPYAAKQVFRILPEASTRTGALTSKQIDVLYGVPSQDISSFTSDSQYKYDQVLNSGTAYSLYFNTTKAPFNDIKVRQAVQKGFDLDAVVKSVYYGTGTRATEWISPASIFYDKSFKSEAKFDKTAAGKLLDSAGWNKRDAEGYRTNSDGKRLTINVYSDAPYIRDSREILFQAISAELKKNLGVDFQFKALDVGTVSTKWEQNQNDAFDNSMGSSDVSGSLDLLLVPWNPARIFLSEDAKVTDLAAKAKTAASKEERKKYYTQLQQYVVNDKAYVLPLYIPRDNWASASSVHGFEVSKIAGHLFSTATVWKDQ
ncbi:MAG: ABC transporter substrate-binding protein [Bifidobacterium sp.]|jgi:peptide/nickel transport system substrate-binding protein|nr:ABC transporter substrate-binding protein [Bifidobacterium sp.]MCH4175381.1 ABC transporter substrate-binding protein [Bifidobacterium sp.]